MELIDGNIAKCIWGFFLEFDDDGRTASGRTVETLPYPSLIQGDSSDRSNNTKLGHGSNSILLDRRIDFRSIRSLRAVNKFFYNAFEEFCGWSRCAVAIKREYRSLQKDENWNFVFRAQQQQQQQAHWAATTPGSTSLVPSNSNEWTLEQRRQVGFLLSRAMERRKISNFRCNQLIRMLDCGPFTKDEKLLTNIKRVVVH